MHGFRRLVFLLWVLLFGALSRSESGRAIAQDLTTGAVGGVVLDSSGAAIVTARVHLEDASLNAVGDLRTGPRGEFFFGGLGPGRFSIRVSAAGFGTQTVQSIEVPVGQTIRLSLHLAISGIFQAVAVREEAIEVPSLGGSPLNVTFSPEELLGLPVDGRRFQSFALLLPLVNLADTVSDTDADTSSAQETDFGSDTVRLTVRGLDPSQNSYARDGLSNTRSYDGEPRGGALLPFNLPQEAVQEFQVRVTGGGTRLGRDAGGSVNAVTRRGQDALRGSAFFLLRNSGVAASNPFAIATRYNNGVPQSEFVKPRDQREQFGGSLGRAIPGSHRHLYGFASIEAQRRSFPGVSSPDDADFFRLTEIQSALLANRGVSRASIARALSYLDSLGGQVPRQANELALASRLDYQTGALAHFSLNYSRVRYNAPSGIRDEAVIPRSRDNFGTLDTHVDDLSINLNHAFSHHWLNTFQAEVSRDALLIEQAPPLGQEPQTGPGGTVPQVSIDLSNSTTGSFTFGASTTLPKRRLPEEKRAEAYETVTFSGHVHTLTLGLGGSLLDTSIETGIATNGAYTYASGSTSGRAGGLVDFITDYTFSANAYPNGGCPSIFAATHLFCFQSYTQTFGASTATRFHTGEGSAFLREAWRFTPHLRMDLGARYEYFRMPLPQRPNAALDSIFGSSASTGFFPGDPGNLAPHLAVAYGLRSRTVVRLGYGVHFGRVTGSLLQQLLQNTAQPAASYSIRITPRTEVESRCASSGTNFGYPATYACIPSATVAQSTRATILSRRFQLPMVQDVDLSLEHGFGHGLTISGSYVLSLARQLPNSIDSNIAPSTSNAAFRIQRSDGAGTPGVQDGYLFNVPLYTSRLSSHFGPVTTVLSNGTGTDNAGIVQFTRISPHGLTVRLSYTYARAFDNVRYTGSTADQDAQFDPRDERFDRASSNYDRKQKIVASAVWMPQVSAPSRFVRSIANGWSAAPLIFATSGRPYSYLISGGSSLEGGRDSINGSGGATYLPTVGRNTLRMPWTATVDLRVLRGFSIRDRLRARLSAEVFNLANHRNITSVQQRAFLPGTPVNGITPLLLQDAATISTEGLTSKPFGTPTSSSNVLTRERRLQFGLRFDW